MAASAFRTDWPDPDRSRSKPKNNNAETDPRKRGLVLLTSTETVDLLGTGAQNGHLDFHAALEIWGIGVGEVEVYTTLVSPSK